MSYRVVDEGWVAPARPGPHRRSAVALLSFGVIALGAWGMLATGWLDEVRGTTRPKRVEVRVAQDGSTTVAGTPVELESHARGGVGFLAGRARTGVGDRRIDVDVVVPVGVDADAISVRVLQPYGDRGDSEVLVAYPEAVFADEAPDAPRGARLQDLTRPFDELVRAERADHRRLVRLRESWWWIALLALCGTVVLPLLAWRRSRRRFFSMRLPGPGLEVGIEPPSSLDPVGAAVLNAGARPLDFGAAFAGHVLDLVDRRQLPMRRSTTTPPGLGTLIGLHHADEVEDVVVPLLGDLVDEDGYTVVLPDTPANVRRLSATSRDTWRAHVLARATFERMTDTPRLRVPGVLAPLATLVLLACLIAAILADGPGARAALLLASVAAASAAATCWAWVVDARSWKVVSRARRNERAQWLAWRAGADEREGPASDQRNLPALVAVDASMKSLRTNASAAAVDLDAVTRRTVEALRIAHDDPA